MPININSESWCRKAYLNYERYGNSMNLTTQEYNEIRQVWSHKLASWDATVTSDENEYDFEDSDYANYKKEGAEEAEKERQLEEQKKQIVPELGITQGELMEKMDMVRAISSTAKAIREEHRLRNRLPLRSMTLAGASVEKLYEFAEVLKEEVNVKLR